MEEGHHLPHRVVPGRSEVEALQHQHNRSLLGSDAWKAAAPDSRHARGDAKRQVGEARGKLWAAFQDIVVQRLTQQRCQPSLEGKGFRILRVVVHVCPL